MPTGSQVRLSMIRNLRPAKLEFLVQARSLGALPAVLLASWTIATFLQEPRFFRWNGLGLMWPSISASADLLCLASCLSSAAGTSSRIFASTHFTRCRWLGLFVFCLSLHGLAILVGVALDAIANVDSTREMSDAALRAFCLWLPLTGLATLPASQVRPRLAALVLTVAGFTMVQFAYPVSLLGQGPRLDKFLSSAMATAGCVILSRPPGRRDSMT